MRYSVPLTAGVPARLNYPGRYLQLMDLGGASALNVEVLWQNASQAPEAMGDLPERFKLGSPDRAFASLVITAPSSVTVDLLISWTDFEAGAFDGATVQIDPATLPLDVDIPGGVQGVDSHDAPMTAKPVTVGGVAGLSAPSSVTVGDAVRAWALPSGALVVQPHNAKQETSEGGTINWTGFINQADELRPVGVVPLLNNGGSAWRWNGGQYGGWVQGPVASNVAAAGNPVQVGAIYNATLAAMTDGTVTAMRASVYGSLRVMTTGFAASSVDAASNTHVFAATEGSSNSISARGLFGVAGSLFNGSTWDRHAKATTTARLPSSAATTNATSVKASAGTVHIIAGATNTSAGRVFLKIYNKASAPTVGTDTPVLTIPINAGATMAPIEFPQGLYLSAGIAYALTTGAADSDTGALASGDVVGLNIAYY